MMTPQPPNDLVNPRLIGYSRRRFVWKGGTSYALIHEDGRTLLRFTQNHKKGNLPDKIKAVLESNPYKRYDLELQQLRKHLEKLNRRLTHEESSQHS